MKATLADGSVALARCALQVDVATDENHALELSLAAPRIPLPGYDSHFSELSAPTPTGLNVLFISHGDFTANSTLQIAALARELATAGHSCVIAIPKDLNTLSYQQSPAFRGLLHVQVLASGGNFPNGRGPDIIHAWTTRESVRTISLAIQEKQIGRAHV